LKNCGLANIAYQADGDVMLETFTIIFKSMEIDASAGSTLSSVILDWASPVVALI
jgi:hypothetical protein